MTGVTTVQQVDQMSDHDLLIRLDQKLTDLDASVGRRFTALTSTIDGIPVRCGEHRSRVEAVERQIAEMEDDRKNRAKAVFASVCAAIASAVLLVIDIVIRGGHSK